MLPYLTALENLHIGYVDLEDVFAPRPMMSRSMLRTLHVEAVDLCDASVGALVDFATRSKQLELVAWDSCAYFGKHKGSAAQVLRACILAGVANGRFKGCDIDTGGIGLSNNTFRLGGVRALLTAIATCTNVTYAARKKARAAGVTVDISDREIYIRSRTLA
ncbi:hypothetical protein SDRG_17121 [Saprolegnia diclina VS20]|uniref:Uncharacterized protein n=1 Tax=Saprolegnia diclina (strain VS20) TaxID=1156394 RepID=T0PS12_SAPDV|nr:hypothetical protein SDRG_17121 [Saprolegnia diclina VS20]EQC25001.1 hypothetical protein SDRG_17121 [Saprolegnia diclina VS20]|eukprot:XP_008621578.1 hypothetical protein SDRG_17121 [Saprolegnia diclina VS20]